jgi:uncharacterized protein
LLWAYAVTLIFYLFTAEIEERLILMTFIELAKLTLEKANTPLTADEIWEKSIEFSYAKDLKSTGKTPQRTISAQLYVNIRDDQNSVFCIADRRPTKFALSSWSEKQIVAKTAITTTKKDIFNYLEKDLHQIMSYFAYNYLNVLSRTIDNRISKNGPKGKNEWLHPDMIGLDISSIKDFSKGVLSFSKQINQTPVSVYSFELKRKIEFSNLREYYFQAVSNSSWANKGYLVCAEID